MHLGVPVLARNIPGNSAVIQHKETGLLFDTPEVWKMVYYNKQNESLKKKLSRNLRPKISLTFW